MNILEARVALRDRPLLDVLDLAVRFLASHAKPFAIVALAVVAPAFLASYAVASAAGWAWGWLFAIGLGLVAQTPFTMLASRLVFEHEVSSASVLRASLATLPRLFAIRITQSLMVVAAFAFLVVPAFWVGTIYLFVLEVVVLERARFGAALARAPRISATESGDALLTFVLLPLLHFVIVVLADAAGRSFLSDMLEVKAPDALFTTGGSALALLGYFAFLPFVATARFFVYLNIRTRGEGWDVQTRFAGLAARSAEGRS